MDSAANNTSYKQLHEEFVSGLQGTSLFEVSLLTSLSAGSILVRDLISLNFDHFKQPWQQFGLNFTILVIPIMLACTVLSHINITIFITLYTMAGGALFILFKQRPITSTSKYKSVFDTFLGTEMGMRRPFISYSRGNALLGTAIAILAVDFTIFPRRLAKAETFGTGVMDAGVGFFVVVNAIVSPEARGKSSNASPVRAVLSAVRSSLPLVILGMLRLLAVKNIDYQEHVSEYGLHWNFFLTLAVVKVLSSVILAVFPASLSGLLSVVVGLGYQYWLTRRGLTDYILHGEDGRGGRHGLLDANREGVYSSIGYLAIYLASVQIGMFIFRKRETVGDWLRALLTLVATSAVSWLLLAVVSSRVQPTSRRLANGPYIIWMVAVNTQIFASFLIGDIIITLTRVLCYKDQTGKKKYEVKVDRSCLLSAMNNNALLYFLLSNVMTGLVNMSVRTIYASPSFALSILTMYMFTLSLIVTVLYRKNISTKIW